MLAYRRPEVDLQHTRVTEGVTRAATPDQPRASRAALAPAAGLNQSLR
jgi:hypothetical protein